MKTYSEEHVDELLKMTELLLELNNMKDIKISKLENRIIDLENTMDEIREVSKELTEHIRNKLIRK